MRFTPKKSKWSTTRNLHIINPKGKIARIDFWKNETAKRYGVPLFGKQVVNIWKRGIHAFSDIFLEENLMFSCRPTLEKEIHFPTLVSQKLKI